MNNSKIRALINLIENKLSNQNEDRFRITMDYPYPDIRDIKFINSVSDIKIYEEWKKLEIQWSYKHLTTLSEYFNDVSGMAVFANDLSRVINKQTLSNIIYQLHDFCKYDFPSAWLQRSLKLVLFKIIKISFDHRNENPDKIIWYEDCSMDYWNTEVLNYRGGVFILFHHLVIKSNISENERRSYNKVLLHHKIGIEQHFPFYDILHEYINNLEEDIDISIRNWNIKYNGEKVISLKWKQKEILNLICSLTKNDKWVSLNNLHQKTNSISTGWVKENIKRIRKKIKNAGLFDHIKINFSRSENLYSIWYKKNN